VVSAHVVTILFALSTGAPAADRAGITPEARGARDSIRAVVSGVVYDSIGRTPLRGAQVQLVGSGESAASRRYGARSDSAGRYAIGGVIPGEYVIGFAHPALDSLGLEAEPRRVRLSGAVETVDLASPSPRTIVRLVCPQSPAPDSTGLVMGHVRSATDASPLPGASVLVNWTEWTSVTGDIGSWRPRQRQATAETTENGWFALCDVPGGAPLVARAAHDPDTTGHVRVTVPPGELRHLTWYVGSGVRASGTSGAGVATASLWRGAARLTGRVRDRSGQPVANAHASVWGAAGDRTTDSRGRFALDGLPSGTQTLEVRALGYAPENAVVHLAAGQPSDVDVTLGERVTELPAVAVRAKESRGMKLDAFYERMEDVKRGINRGYFITPEEIESRKPPFITNMMDGLPGVYVDRRGGRLNIPRGILRDPKDPLRRCEMAVFLDGMQILGGLRDSMDHVLSPRRPDSIDEIAPASHIAAVEVYVHPVMAPPQYQMLNGNCGIILLWTK
jgi:hypothetical protein